MFFRKKKTTERGNRPARAKQDDFGLGIPGFGGPGNDDNDDELEAELFRLTGQKPKQDDFDLNTGDDDEDFEAELARLMGKPTKSGNKIKAATPVASSSRKEHLKNVQSVSIDVDEEGDEDIDENDPDLLNELQMLTVDDNEIEEQGSDEEVEKKQEISQAELIRTRLKAYNEAEAKAKQSNESSRARRFNRGVKTLEKLLKRAMGGEIVPYDEIPPEIASNLKPASVYANDLNLVVEPTTLQTDIKDTNDNFDPELPSADQTEPPDQAVSLSDETILTDKKMEEEKQEINQIELIRSRLISYRDAEAKAKLSNESSRARRFNRGVKTLEALLKRATAGEIVPYDEIPPETATNLKPASSYVNDPIKPLEVPSDLPETGRTETIAKDVPTPTAVEEKADESTIELKVEKDGLLQLIEERREQYKMHALNAKKSGDVTTALSAVKVVKLCDKLIEARKQGSNINKSEIPSPPATSSTLKHTPSSNKKVTQVIMGRSTHHGELFNVPTTVMEALEQRLTYYTRALQKAEASNNRNDVRRFADITRIYQNAIKLHQKGARVPYEKLPTPPGCPPIPLAFE